LESTDFVEARLDNCQPRLGATMSVHNVTGSAPVRWIAQPPHEALRRGRPLLPPNDPFYQPPSGYHHAEPGTVLRSRDVELALFGLIPQRLPGTQLLYRTTDMEGRPEATVTTVLLPSGRNLQKACPLLSYQCAIDAVAARCFPSYALRRGALAIGALAQLELVLIAAALAEGCAVSVPDHEGLGGRWGAPCEPGYRILDGIRASLACARLGLSASGPVGLWGYSGGGLATAWAAEMSAEYAPELNVVGAVLGSPVGDPGNAFRRLNGSWASGLPTLMVSSLVEIYPELGRVMQQHLTDKGSAVLTAVRRMTTASGVLRFANTDMADHTSCSLDQILDLPEVQYVFKDIRLGRSVPAPPVLMVQAVHDPIIAVEDIDALAETYTAGGAAVTYHRDMLSGHALLHPMSAPMALGWLTDRFAGRPLTGHVVRTTWPTLLSPATYRGMARLTVIAAKVIAGRSIGRPRLVLTARGVRQHPAMSRRRTKPRGPSQDTSSNSQHALSLCADEVPNSVEDSTS
jgi:alpha-beta hydrolase superfamily lysophospholipase